jgi:putative NIF3 family GTP cyclohydrolase 1 type 2
MKAQLPGFSRRDFITAASVAAAAAGSALAQSAALTAGQVVERIQKNLGAPWRGGMTDTFKTGGPDTAVKGIVSTMMSTFDVLKRSAAAGKNMVITHEPTFWTGNDDVSQFQNDLLYKKKAAFIKEHDLVIWRFHDHLHAQRPDKSHAGLIRQLGWDKYASAENAQVCTFPPITLKELARDVEKRLNIKGIRVIGDPAAQVSRGGIAQGAPPFHASRLFQQVDVIVAGEQREWEGVEYAWDLQSAGEQKGMILIGHWVSEEAGMRLTADWLKTFITEVPIEWISAGEPFWRP